MSVETTASTFEYARDWLVSSDTFIESILLADGNSQDERRDQARLRIHREEALDKPDEEAAGETAPDTPPPFDARPRAIIKLADDTRDLVGTGTFAGSGTLHIMIEALIPEEFIPSPDDDTATLAEKFQDRKAWAIDKCNVIRLELLETSGRGDAQGNPYLNARKVLVSLWPNDPDEYEPTDNFMGWMYEVPWREQMADSPFPVLVCTLDVPDRAEDMAVRYHNKYAKESLRDAVERWHGADRHSAADKGFPSRFTREAKTRFHHFERSPKYKRMKAKKYHSTMDLVKTGDSKDEMLHRFKIELGGTAEKGTLRVTLSMRFAFKGGSGRFRKQGTVQEVQVEKMLLELESCDQRDAEMIAKWMLEGYMKRINEHRKSRKRVRLPKR